MKVGWNIGSKLLFYDIFSQMPLNYHKWLSKTRPSKKFRMSYLDIFIYFGGRVLFCTTLIRSQFWGTRVGLSRKPFLQKFELLAVSHFVILFYNRKFAPERAQNGFQTFFSILLRSSVVLELNSWNLLPWHIPSTAIKKMNSLTKFTFFTYSFSDDVTG